ncbi:DUF6950 family protein [Klebsiella aerogenes]|uniref:DUF6950 family protein n=1 Tax=Klebsiella aerogenes TaxID=548 RepID=UPI002278849C|nr:hypothetical protein [Klebsiella aerogenes]MCY4762676.1 hypothetical protein [Klebsiella aerogenes]
MFKFQAELSNFLNEYINAQHVFGQNDCNILIADYLDRFCDTDYRSKLQGKYSTISEGVQVCNENVGFSNVKEACEKHLEKSDRIELGSVLLKKKTIKRKVYYVATIVFNDKAITEENNKYKMTDVKYVDYDLIFNRRK